MRANRPRDTEHASLSRHPGLYLDKSIRLINWDKIRSWKKDRGALEYAALDAAVSYCAHMRLADLEATAAAASASGEPASANDVPIAQWDVVEVCDADESVIAVVDKQDLTIDEASPFIGVTLSGPQLMAPEAKAFLSTEPSEPGVYISNLDFWRTAVLRAAKERPHRHFETLADASEVSFHDIFEVATLAHGLKVKVPLKAYDQRLRRGYSTVAYARCLNPVPDGSMRVLLDLFHAEQRLTQGVNKQHDNYAEYLGLIRDCFLKVDEEEFELLVLREAARRQQDPKRVRFDLLTREWPRIRKLLPKHIPPRHRLEAELNLVLAKAELMTDEKHGHLMRKETRRVSDMPSLALTYFTSCSVS